jgi:hypothetical protein
MIGGRNHRPFAQESALFNQRFGWWMKRVFALETVAGTMQHLHTNDFS